MKTPIKRKLGSYAGSTIPQVQGKGSNQSQADLKDIGDQFGNSGLALRKVIPTPSGASYEDFQKNLHTPAGRAQKAAMEAKLGVSRLSDVDYQQRVFDQGLGKVREQANATPTQSIFPAPVRDAALQQNRTRDLTLGNRAQPTTKTVVDPGTLQDRSSTLPTSQMASSPGMPLQAPPTPMPIKRKLTSTPALAKYAEGTQGIKPKPRKLTMAQEDARNEKMEPSVLPKPDNDGDLDQVVAENPSLKGNTTIPSIASPSSQGSGLARGGTEAVAAYQRKLNSMGANLKVDGAWGDKTQAAFTQFQGKATPKATIRKAPKEVVSGMSGGDIAGARKQEADGDPIPYSSFGPKQDAEMGAKGMDTQDWYDAYKAPETTSPSGQKTKKVSGYQIYPNGRTLTPGGTMRNGTVLPKRKIGNAPTPEASPVEVSENEYLKKEKPSAYAAKMAGDKERKRVLNFKPAVKPDTRMYNPLSVLDLGVDRKPGETQAQYEARGLKRKQDIKYW